MQSSKYAPQQEPSAINPVKLNVEDRHNVKYEKPSRLREVVQDPLERFGLPSKGETRYYVSLCRWKFV